VDAVPEAFLQHLQFFVDAVFRLEPGKFVGEGLLPSEIEGFDPALHFVERALNLFKPGEGIVDVLVVEPRAQLDTVGGGFLPRNDRLFARLGIGELCLQLSDVFVLLGERVLDLLALVLQRGQRPGNPRLGAKCTLGEVVALLCDGEFGAASRSSVATRRSISFFSAIVRTAEERTSTSVSSISWMMSRIIFSGSWARSRIALMLEFTISARREKIPMVVTPTAGATAAPSAVLLCRHRASLADGV